MSLDALSLSTQKYYNRYTKDTRGLPKASYAHATVCTGQGSIKISNA